MIELIKEFPEGSLLVILVLLWMLYMLIHRLFYHLEARKGIAHTYCVDCTCDDSEEDDNSESEEDD